MKVTPRTQKGQDFAPSLLKFFAAHQSRDDTRGSHAGATAPGLASAPPLGISAESHLTPPGTARILSTFAKSCGNLCFASTFSAVYFASNIDLQKDKKSEAKLTCEQAGKNITGKRPKNPESLWTSSKTSIVPTLQASKIDLTCKSLNTALNVLRIPLRPSH